MDSFIWKDSWPIFLAHLSWRLISELIVKVGIRLPSSGRRQHFQTSPQKSLGQLKPNFIWSLHWSGEWKFFQMVMFTWPRWPPCPHMVKTFKNLLLQNQTADDLCSIGYSSTCTTKDPRLTFDLFTERSNLLPCGVEWSYAFIREKAWTEDFSETVKE